MDFKDYKEMSNSEIMLYKTELENEFERLKVKINSMCDELDKVENDYNNAEGELSRRGIVF